MRTVSDDVIVVGSGIAGLVCALSLAPRRVTLITKTDGLAGGASYWAKGGIAAALGPGDSPKAHALDTLEAGAGLSHPRRALGLAEDGVESLRLLIDEGVPFDRALDGSLALAREAAHRHARVIHAGGDATGEILVESLARRVENAPDVEVLDNTFAYDLVVEDGAVRGLVTLDPRHGWSVRQARHVVLATGGIGMAWWHTTNPRESTGDGLAMAARAGARLTDLEFMQFHPTALAVGGDGASLPLLTEALRGAGAILVDERGERFMTREHPQGELAPRDVVARAIHQRIVAGSTVYMDLRPVIDSGKTDAFPQAFDAARAAGLDPARKALPVSPAAHYHMGGVQTNRKGRTTIDGLWACGEVATTGIHGANRLASNSLLEGLVYARRVADDVLARDLDTQQRPLTVPAVPVRSESAGIDVAGILCEARQLMSRHLGIARTARGMEAALTRLTDLQLSLGNALPGGRFADTVTACEARNLLLVSRLVTLAACKREESRGAHFRADFPKTRPTWKRRQRFTLDSANLETEALP